MGKANAKEAVQQAKKLIAGGQFRRASKITAQLAAAFPTNLPILLMHASTLERRGRSRQAIGVLEKVKGAISPDSKHYPITVVSIARAQAMMGALDESVQTLLDAEHDSTSPLIAGALIDRYMDLDEQDHAMAVCSRWGIGDELSAQTDPVLAIAWARAVQYTVPIEQRIDQLAAIVKGTKHAQALSLVLGRLLEEAERFDEAFEQYRQSNASNPPEYQRTLASARADSITAQSCDDPFSSINRPEPDAKRARPILIVGMPRSGTSLVEQILGAHPQIGAAGESQALPEVLGILTKNTPPVRTNEQLLHRLSELQAIYLDELIVAATIDAERPPPFITDKNPMNLFLLIHALAIIPDAVVVRVHRDPRDVCFSCFTSPLANDHTYKFKLTDCAHFAATAHRALEHAKAIVESDGRARWVEIEYEALTQDPRNAINALFESIGLEPDPACFAFHKSTRAVQTISRDQVRRPMHTRSLARWKNFDHLPEIKEMLAQLSTDGLIDSH